ncbi:MAG: cytochrome b/b6 domain-containing protein [Rhodocyclaceae bacterium]|nr:cytochrome b/b6 domain-containing protein [Rhodocyclaceae bacterium]
MQASIEQQHAGVDGTEHPAVERTRVWDLPTRIFHWSFAATFALAWLTSESEKLADLHLMLGYTFGGLLLFRLIWGILGSRYARFSSFLFQPSALLRYLRSLLSGAPEHHLGHNPAGALAIFLMLGLALAVAISGVATSQDLGGEWLEELHEGAASAMLAVVAIHIAGVIVSSVLHRENLALAMVTGWKQGRAADGIARFHHVLGILLLLAVFGFWGLWQSGVAVDWLPAPTAAVGEHHGYAGDDDD